MRVSAVSLWEAAGTRKIKKYVPDTSYEIEERCRHLQENVNIIPQTEEEIAFDEAMGMVATEIAMERHVGVIESVYTPMGIIYSLTSTEASGSKGLVRTAREKRYG
jgi:uncharacterized protein (TIGR01319 family)